jgi:hypothetical protein
VLLSAGPGRHHGGRWGPASRVVGYPLAPWAQPTIYGDPNAPPIGRPPPRAHCDANRPSSSTAQPSSNQLSGAIQPSHLHAGRGCWARLTGKA